MLLLDGPKELFSKKVSLFKRVTFFPQIILGVIFNWGILIGFLSFSESLEIGLIFLYLGGVFLNELKKNLKNQKKMNIMKYGKSLI